jgi:hypothetical protein
MHDAEAEALLHHPGNFLDQKIRFLAPAAVINDEKCLFHFQLAVMWRRGRRAPPTRPLPRAKSIHYTMQGDD